MRPLGSMNRIQGIYESVGEKYIFGFIKLKLKFFISFSSEFKLQSIGVLSCGFQKIYLRDRKWERQRKWEREREKERGRERSLSCWFILPNACNIQGGARLKSGNPEIKQGLPLGWPGSNYLSYHCRLQGTYQQIASSLIEDAVTPSAILTAVAKAHTLKTFFLKFMHSF